MNKLFSILFIYVFFTLTTFSKEISYQQLQNIYQEKNGWGLHTTIDLKNCNPELIRSYDIIKKYIIELCEFIEMKRFGDPQIVHFGQDKKVAGYSMVQLIETSCIAGHFANETNNAYIDIFSCKFYDPYAAAEFTKNFFKAEEMDINILIRK